MPVIVGAGGHAKVVIDAMLCGGTPREAIGVRDGNAARAGGELLGFAIATPELPQGTRDALHIAIGNNGVRARLHEKAARSAFVTVVHPAATVAHSATLGAGSFVAAGAIVGPAAQTGKSVIVNHGAVIDHDCSVGDFSHVAPNATLGGCVTVGLRVLIGAGAVVLPGVSVGDDAIVGAGAVVLGDIGAGETWAGNPAAKLG
jgi:sugar O-acyltransferase (sialic acid O-acetyltransferase NeuD family)